MARTTWKQVERDAAALFGGRRCWANSGERVDAEAVEGQPFHFVVQVKNPAKMSLAELERLVDEMTVRGVDEGKIPAVVVKRSARRPTPMLVLVPASAWKIFYRLFSDALKDLTAEEASEIVRCEVENRIQLLPGVRKRVAEYVVKSRARARGTSDRTRRWRENGGQA